MRVVTRCARARARARVQVHTERERYEVPSTSPTATLVAFGDNPQHAKLPQQFELVQPMAMATLEILHKAIHCVNALVDAAPCDRER